MCLFIIIVYLNMFIDNTDKEKERKLEKVILELNRKGNNITRAASLSKAKEKHNDY